MASHAHPPTDTTLSYVSVENTERLRAIPLFAELPQATLERMAAAFTHVELPSGQTLTQRDDPGTGMYVIEEGTVVVDLHERTVELGAGDTFGELSLLVPGASRSARVRATSPVQCLVIGRAELMELLETEPKLGLAMLSALARRLIAEIEAP